MPSGGEGEGTKTPEPPVQSPKAPQKAPQEAPTATPVPQTEAPVKAFKYGGEGTIGGGDDDMGIISLGSGKLQATYGSDEQVSIDRNKIDVTPATRNAPPSQEPREVADMSTPQEAPPVAAPQGQTQPYRNQSAMSTVVQEMLHPPYTTQSASYRRAISQIGFRDTGEAFDNKYHFKTWGNYNLLA